MEFWLFLPQMRLTIDQLVERARAAEAAGFAGVAGMDHLTPPLADSQPMFEGMITNTWLASQTEALRVGSLVLCDSFRHPAVLARQAVTLTTRREGALARYRLGLGGRRTRDFRLGSQQAKVRLGRLRESLEIMTALWTGEPLDYEGEHFTLHGAEQVPGPVSHIPIVIGGAGKGTMRLVAEHADWWNVHTHIVDKLDDMRPLAGNARAAAGPGGIRAGRRRPGRDRNDGAPALRGRLPSSAPRPNSSIISAPCRTRRGTGLWWFCDFAAPGHPGGLRRRCHQPVRLGTALT